MEKLLLLGAFLLIRHFVTSSFKKKNNNAPNAQKKSKPNKNLEDLLGGFMEELAPKAKPIMANTDTHKAELDSAEQLDWQKVSTSKFTEKKQLLKHSDYNKVSHSNENIETIDVYEEEVNETSFELEEIDLRKAVLYKEILDRKYFTI